VRRRYGEALVSCARVPLPRCLRTKLTGTAGAEAFSGSPPELRGINVGGIDADGAGYSITISAVPEQNSRDTHLK
jgi:hypothetical protein